MITEIKNEEESLKGRQKGKLCKIKKNMKENDLRVHVS